MWHYNNNTITSRLRGLLKIKRTVHLTVGFFKQLTTRRVRTLYQALTLTQLIKSSVNFKNKIFSAMKTRLYSFLPVFLCGLAIPISMFMWLGNLAFSKLRSHPEYDGK